MGDAGKPLRMSCASGIPMAWIAADTIAPDLTGGKPRQAPRWPTSSSASALGRKEGLIQFVTADDQAKDGLAPRPHRPRCYKEFICKAAAWGAANPTLALPVRTQARPGQGCEDRHGRQGTRLGPQRLHLHRVSR